jgi:hypothetical protein
VVSMYFAGQDMCTHISWRRTIATAELWGVPMTCSLMRLCVQIDTAQLTIKATCVCFPGLGPYSPGSPQSCVSIIIRVRLFVYAVAF